MFDLRQPGRGQRAPPLEGQGVLLGGVERPLRVQDREVAVDPPLVAGLRKAPGGGRGLGERPERGQLVLDRRALREGVRHDLQGELNRKQRRSIREQVVQALLDRVQFELPESLVQSETKNVVYDIVQENARRGEGQKCHQ